jgi:hypothetical protein
VKALPPTSTGTGNAVHSSRAPRINPDVETVPMVTGKERKDFGSNFIPPAAQNKPKKCKRVTSVGFEPTPMKTTALTLRLRPLGQDVDAYSRTHWHIESYFYVTVR